MTIYSENEKFTAPNEEIESRVEQIIDRLTLEEKIQLLGGQGNGTLDVCEDKGVPMLKMADGPVGVHWWCDKSTAYPALIALAATWDRETARRMGHGLGLDCRARGVHILLAPGVNIYRSPLCGRNFEYMGEDPFLASRMVVPWIQGVQAHRVAATVKHYAVNFQEYDRHGVSSDADERTLREVYLPAFRAAIVEAGSGCIMTGYNLVNGQHCSENEFLNNVVLKGDWAFDGVCMSDWTSVYSDVGPANFGLDLEMPNAKYMTGENLVPAVENGLVTEEAINDKIRRMLRLAACFGWLDNEQKDESIPMDNPETGEIALEVCRRGFVMLKNEDNFLPLNSSTVKKVAVVGYHADTWVICGGGSAYTQPYRVVTPLEGIRRAAGPEVEVVHARGVNPVRHKEAFADSEFFTPDGERGLKGEYFANADLAGEPAVVRVDEQVDFAWHGRHVPEPALEGKPFSVRWTGEVRPEEDGEYVFYLRAHDAYFKFCVDGELVLDSGNSAQSGVQSATKQLKGGESYSVRYEWRQQRHWNAARLGWENVNRAREEYEEALQAAREADAVVICTGFTADSESEGFDRHFALPGLQEDFIREIADANPNAAVLLHAGGNVDMDGWLDGVKGLLHVWYPGQNGGQAAAEILFGHVNPSGKLPATFERKLEDRGSTDCYHDEDGDKRVQMRDGVFTGYRHFDREDIEPRFPFGFGLSYTEFAFENLELSTDTVDVAEGLTVRFDVVNTGDRAGAEVAQLYLSDVEATVPRPPKELKGFARVELEPGERQTVEIELGPDALEFFDMDMATWTSEPGEFRVLVGSSSRDVHLEASFRLEV
jgi:beta-glucosidase